MGEKRDTQFAGFAKALWDEIAEEMAEATAYGREYSIADGSIEWIIARRAFDLAVHIAHHVNVCGEDLKSKFWTASEIVEGIPDLAELPKEQDD